MIDFKIKIDKPPKFPALNLGKETFEEVGEIASASIVLNVKSGKQADGSDIKKNAPSTILRKRLRKALFVKGGKGSVRSLIDTKGRFIQSKGGSWRWFAHENRAVVEPATAELRKLSRYVQERGYVGWFDVSKKGWTLIRKVIRERLTEIVKGRA